MQLCLDFGMTLEIGVSHPLSAHFHWKYDQKFTLSNLLDAVETTNEIPHQIGRSFIINWEPKE